MPISSLFATATPTNAALPISDGSGAPGFSLDAWVSNGSGGPVAAEDVTYSNGSSGLSATNVQDAIDELALSSGSGGGGTVTTVSVATANGFAGSVSNPTTTPEISIETTETGVLVGDGTAVSGIAPGPSGNILTSDGSSWSSEPPAASAGTKTIARFFPRDNQPPTSLFATLGVRTTGSTVVDTLNFSNAAQWEAYFPSIMPQAADLSIGLSATIWFGATAATSGDVTWDIAFSRIPNGSAPSAYSTAQTFTATAVPGTLTYEASVTKTIAAADLPSGLAAGDRFITRIRRTTAGLAEPAQFTAAELQTQ